jgi:hypothetical protein
MIVLDLLQNSQQRSRTPSLPDEYFVDELLIQIRRPTRRRALHWLTPISAVGIIEIAGLIALSGGGGRYQPQ